MSNADVRDVARVPIIDELLSHFAVTEQTFEVPVVGAGGEVVVRMTMRRLASYAELDSYKARAAEFIKSATRRDGHHEAWKPYLPISRAEAAAAFVIHWFSAEPTKLSELEAMRLVKCASPWISEYLVNAINQNQMQGLDAKAEEAVESEKNAFGEIGGTEHVSPSPATSSESTTGT